MANLGTDVHEAIYRLLKKIEDRLPPNAVFTEKQWEKLESVLGVKVPKRGKGLDIVVLNRTTKPPILSGVDITRTAGRAKHVRKGLDDLAAFRAALEPKGWKVAEELLEPTWRGKTPEAVVDELVGLLNKLAGRS